MSGTKIVFASVFFSVKEKISGPNIVFCLMFFNVKENKVLDAIL